jgi:RNA polymerase sigma factor (sigma-70 family)
MRSTADLTNVIRQFGAPATDAPGDPELLERYWRGRDEAAFATLVRRYGPLVLGVARRQLADSQGAEDVFQATFLALARCATKLGRRPVLANWLYTVALRQARKARARATRREALELAAPARPLGGVDPLAEITGRELLQAIDDELARLPDRLRLPVLLCCVQGLSREEAAQRLGCSDAVVKGRLERGRRRLAARLAARGLAPSALVLAPLAAVTVPADLLARSVEQSASPWSKAIPAAVTELATRAPRLLLPVAALAGCALAVGLVGWAIAAPSVLSMGSARVDRPAAGQKPASPDAPPAAPAPAANPAPDDPLPVGATLRFGSPRFRHPTTIEGLAVSADGKVAIAHSGMRSSGAVRAYDLATGRVLVTFDGVNDVEAVAFAPDGKSVAFKRRFSVCLHDATTGKETDRVQYPRANSYSTIDLLFYAPDGRHVVVAAAEAKGLHLIDFEKREVVRTVSCPGSLFAAALSPDGKHVVAGGYDYEKGGGWFAHQWEVGTGRERNRLALGKDGMRSAAYSPDGATVAVGGENGRGGSVLLIDAATGKERLKIPFPEATLVQSVAFSPDGETVAASGGASTRLFDTATGKETLKIDRKATGLRFSKDGATLTGAVCGTIYRWEAATGEALTPEGGDSAVAQIAVAADGKRLVTRGQDGDAHVWEVRTGEHQRRVTVGWQRGFALSPDGRFLVWPVADETIRFKEPDRANVTYTGSRLRMMDLTTGKLVERFGGFEGTAEDLSFTPDGKALVTADRYRRGAAVRVWNVESGKVERSFAAEGGKEARVWRERLSPDAKVLAVMYRGQERGLRVETQVKLWEVASGKELDGPAPPWFDPDVMTFSPDGKTMAVATADGKIEFRDAATGELRGEFPGPRDRVTALAFGPDGQLFTGFADATVLAWTSKVGKPPAERK